MGLLNEWKAVLWPLFHIQKTAAATAAVSLSPSLCTLKTAYTFNIQLL